MKQLHHFDEVFDSQEVFRILLEAMANPTRELSIAHAAEKLYGTYPHILAAAMTLLDHEVSFCVCDDQELAEQIILLTQAKETALEEADYIFVTDGAQLDAPIAGAKTGTLADPHKSATMLIEIDDAKDHRLCFSGPGIKDTENWETSADAKRAIVLRDEQAYEYPQGIDFIFVRKSGTVTCIPRITVREV